MGVFGNNNNFNNAGQQNNGEPKKKVNFKMGKVYGDDATMDVGVWTSDSGVFAILTIYQQVGKDPSTGKGVYETKPPKELPRLFMNRDRIIALVSAMTAYGDNPGEANFTMDGNSKLKVEGLGNKVKLTITDKLGERTITLGSFTLGKVTTFPQWTVVRDLLKIAYRKALIDKIDNDDFNSAINTSDDNDSPF